jgi:hypothetical protein
MENLYISWMPHKLSENDIEWEWENTEEEITELLEEINPNGFWYCTVKNFGWRKTSGEAYLQFTNGRDFVIKVLPKTNCSFNIFREENKLKIQNYHHDSPTGDEWYELAPITEEKYNHFKI